MKSHFSLLDGIAKPKDIIKRLIEIQVPSGAITDHGSTSGCIEFLQKMTKANLKPLLGTEFYICEKDPTIRDNTNRKLTHFLLYAKNNTGWETLVKIISLANDPAHFYYKPRLDIKTLSTMLDGNIIGVCGHLGSTLSHYILEENDRVHPNAINRGIYITNKFKEIFGKDNFYLEAQLYDTTNIPIMDTLTSIIRQISIHTKTPIVACADSHYCNREDSFDQRVVLCRSLGNITIAEARRKGALNAFFVSDKFHIPSYDEMVEYGHSQEELDNTNLFASQFSSYDNILKDPILPQFKCPNNENVDDYLRQLCREGWKTKIKDRVDDEQVYVDRVKHELDILQSANLSSYFLIVSDIMSYIENNNWMPSIGRGSASGCLVSYLIGVTRVNPIKYGLIFERFFDASRSRSLPDIDMDVPVHKRGQIIKYIKNKYGKNKVSQMLTHQTIKGRGALKDVLRAYGGITFDEMNRITEHIEEETKISSELQEMETELGYKSIIRQSLIDDKKKEKMKQWCHITDDGDLEGPLAKRFEQAIRLEGTKIAMSKHPAGIVISDTPLNEVCPMTYDAKEKQLIAGLEMGDLESIGMVKFDLLGLNFLDKMMGVREVLKCGEIQ